MDDTPKKLHRIQQDKILFGVATGLADYFALDVALVRVVFILLALFQGLGILLYLILIIVMSGDEKSANANIGESVKEFVDQVQEKTQKKVGEGKVFFGYLIIFMGLVLLLKQLIPDFDFPWRIFWPLILIALGLVILLKPKQI